MSNLKKLIEASGYKEEPLSQEIQEDGMVGDLGLIPTGRPNKILKKPINAEDAK